MCAAMKPDDLDIDAIRALAIGQERRISTFEHGGQRYWAKRLETLKPRMRLQKGSPKSAFERERTALRALNAADGPVPQLVIDDPALMVIPHCGTNLLALPNKVSRDEALVAYRNAGVTLARLHQLGFAHGRPALRDLCWDGDKITIIDFERAKTSLYTPRGRARDMVLLGFNAIAVNRGRTKAADIILEGYRAAADDAQWHAVARWSRQLEWMAPATAPLKLLPLPMKEVRTMPLARDYFRALRASQGV